MSDGLAEKRAEIADYEAREAQAELEEASIKELSFWELGGHGGG